MSQFSNGLAAAAGSEQSGQLAGGVVTVTSLSARKSPKDLEMAAAWMLIHEAWHLAPVVSLPGRVGLLVVLRFSGLV